ncbi:hypothetical protein ACQRBN_06620 [Bariatricus sp. SGI.154]|uniref:hypothetical protein n=1 Tax=Bariatricus sp. SGI.154 TaxID=3420549 RepID=UPI003CFBEE56
MFDFMDEIVEAVEDFGNEAVEIAATAILFLLKAVILITAPIWILPYKILGRPKGD